MFIVNSSALLLSLISILALILLEQPKHAWAVSEGARN